MPTAPTPKFESIKKNTLKIEYLRGIDVTNQPSNVDDTRTSNGTNMIRDVPGKVRKRQGFYKARKYPYRINGAFRLRDKLIIHSGTNIYIDGDEPKLLYTNAADVKSSAVQMGGKLWFLDGKQYLYCDGEVVAPVSDIAFIPTITIGRRPNGGGETYNPVNMLTSKVKESFLGEAGTGVYQLSLVPLTNDSVTAQVRNSSGTWVNLTEGSNFTVNRETGMVAFFTAPGESPVTGEDNVIISYSSDYEDYIDRINRCRFMICYGVYGAADRVFMSGDPEHLNLDYHSELDDPTYMGDDWFGAVGQDHSAIVGYSIVTDQLATHKRNDDNKRNIILRYGNMDDDNEPVFPISGIVQGDGAVAEKAFGFSKEPIFLTDMGICAATPLEYSGTGERYIQNRSFYINQQLVSEPNKEEAYACIYQDFYMLALNNKVYIMDTLTPANEKTITGVSQYEAYLWTNIPARTIYTFDEELCFGTEDGYIMKFFTDTESIFSYADMVDPNIEGSGEAIKARWDYEFKGDMPHLRKRVRYVAIRIAPSVATSVGIWARVRGVWQETLNFLGGMARYLAFSRVVFSKFSFSGDTNPRTIGRKIKIKKVDSVLFSFRNEELFEPFGIYELVFEYTEQGYYRG